jgi:acyl carrier protein
MTEETILQVLKEIFATINPKQNLEQVTMDSSLAEDLGLDSLTLLLLSMSIETRFDIRIEQGVQFDRVADVVKYIAVRNDGK